jgi:hypothetical protein
MKCNPFIIEGAIASEVKTIEKYIPYTVIKQDSKILSHQIGNEYFLLSIKGSSMEHEKIFDGDIVLFNGKFDKKDLCKGQVLAIRISEDVELNAGKCKLRIFDNIGIDGTIEVCKYKGNKKVLSKGKHDISNVEGIKEEVINHNDSKVFLDKYSEKLEVEILKYNNIYCAKFNDIEYFLSKIEEFILLSKEHQKSVNDYIIDTILEYGDTKEDAKNNFKSRFQEGLSIFQHLKTKKTNIDKLSRIYFKFLELANNQIKFF